MKKLLLVFMAGFIGLCQLLHASSYGHYFPEVQQSFWDNKSYFTLTPFKIAVMATASLPVTLEEKSSRKKVKSQAKTSVRFTENTKGIAAEPKINFSRKQPQKGKLKISRVKSDKHQLANETLDAISVENQKIKLKKFTRLKGSKVRFHGILSNGKIVYYPAHKKDRLWKKERKQAQLTKQKRLADSHEGTIEDTLDTPQTFTIFEDLFDDKSEYTEESQQSDNALSDSDLSDNLEDLDIFDKDVLEFYDAYEARITKANRKFLN